MLDGSLDDSERDWRPYYERYKDMRAVYPELPAMDEEELEGALGFDLTMNPSEADLGLDQRVILIRYATWEDDDGDAVYGLMLYQESASRQRVTLLEINESGGETEITHDLVCDSVPAREQEEED